MTRSLFILAVLIAATLTLISGVIQGRLTNRWGVSADLEVAAARLNALRGDIGSWQLQQAMELSPQVTNTLQCAGYLYQSYVNTNTGDTVAVVVLAGPAGPISVHIPEICYSASDYTLEGERQKVIIPNVAAGDETWFTNFRANDLSGGGLRVYYAWSDGGPWRATVEPRVTFAGHAFLYKLQIAVRLPTGATTRQADAGLEFLADFIPAFQRAQATAGTNFPHASVIMEVPPKG